MLTNLPRYCVAICVLASVAQSTRAADLLPADRPIAEVIDHYTDEKLKAAGVTPAPQADDATIVRRLMLDLTGRIPTAAEAQQYVASTDPKKRSQLVDRLIDSPWFVRHSATQYNLMLRGVDGDGPDQRGYLLAALGENRPWNRMVRELLGGMPGDAADPLGPEQFVLKRLNDQDLLTRDVSSMFFGINITCCQCHTHPYVDSLSQDYFFGMKAFFSRSYEFQGKLFEKRFAPSKVKFKNNDGEEREVGLMFLTGTVVETPDAAVPDLNKAIAEENKLIGELNKKFGKEKKFPPAASFSPRGQLVKVAELPEGQRLIARSIVNRLWFRFYGHALVMRVDQMHAENSPSHPELLEWLSRDFIAHGWDLRRLTRGLVSSQAYSRSSRWTEKTPPRKDLFAVAELRPLTPMQFGMSVLMLGNSDFAAPQDADALTKRIEGLERSAGGTFGSIIDRPQLGLQINVNEPLGMSNDAGRIRAITSRLVPQLMKLDDPHQQIDLAVWSVLGRPPTSQEVELLTRYLADHSTLSANERARIEEAQAAHRAEVKRAEARAVGNATKLKALSAANSAGTFEELVLADRPVAWLRCQPPAEQDAERVTANSALAVKPAIRAVCRGDVRFVDGLPGTQGQAAAFDGKSAHLHAPIVKALQLDTLSVEFWFKTTQKFDNTFWPGSAAFVSVATVGDGTSDFTINAASTRRGEDQGRLLFCTGPAGTGRDHYLWSPTEYRLNDGRWHHVVATRTRAGEKHLYLDGRLAASEPDAGGQISNDRPLQIGGEQFHPGGGYLDGAMDEIAIYAHVLPPERIAAHFAAVQKHLAPREVSFAMVQPKAAVQRKLAATPSPAVPTDTDLARKACEHIVWALVAGPEFRFNH